MDKARIAREDQIARILGEDPICGGRVSQDTIERIAALSTASGQELEQWQPIETAPTDWTSVDLWVSDQYGQERIADCRASVGNGNAVWHRYDSEFGWRRLQRQATHWRSPPEPPAIRSKLKETSDGEA